MLQALTRLFETGAGAERPEDHERDLRVATAALFFEVVRADGTVADEERRALRAAIESTFDIPAAEVDELMRVAEEKSREAASLYEFTHLVDKRLGPEDKKRIVELLWLPRLHRRPQGPAGGAPRAHGGRPPPRLAPGLHRRQDPRPLAALSPYNPAP